MGAAIKAVIPRYFSFTVFCFAQVLTDCETFCNLVRGAYPVHRWLHTYLGASVVALVCVIVGRPLCQVVLRLWLAWRGAPFKRCFPATDRIPLTSVVTAAFIGTYSHVLLDSIMHADVEPFRPWSVQNPLYGVISVFTLHALCVLLGVFGGWYVARQYKP